MVDNPAAISQNKFSVFSAISLPLCLHTVRCIQFSDARGFTMATTAAEAVGLIKGSAEIVKLQQMTQATQQSETMTQLQQLSNIVHDLSQVDKTTQTKLTPQQALRLPNLILPEFTGREGLGRFLDQVSTSLEASGVPPQHWLTFVK